MESHETSLSAETEDRTTRMREGLYLGDATEEEQSSIELSLANRDMNSASSSQPTADDNITDAKGSVSSFPSISSVASITQHINNGQQGLSADRERALLSVITSQRSEIEQLRLQVACLSTQHPLPDSNSRVVGSEPGNEFQPTGHDNDYISLTIALPALLRGLTTKEDVRNVRNMCERICGANGWEELLGIFYEHIINGRDSLPSYILEAEVEMEENWYREAWYLMYPQWTGTKDDTTVGNFDTATRMLPYVRRMGFQNVCLLPHYESPMADGGYDVSSYTPRKSLGGVEGYRRFMSEAHRLGIRIATDGIFNHTSTEHAWFQAALNGDERYLDYYVQRNGREKIAEWDRDGDIICQYRDPDGSVSERVVVFPDIDRTHGLWVEINGKTYQFYRTFYPFQVDLNLRNAEVLGEIFGILSTEVSEGVVGKRMDAVAHWIKKPGLGEGLAESHAVQALLKSFLRHMHCRAVVIPEVVSDMETASSYAGMQTRINRGICASEGDAIGNFEMQAALREMCLFQTVQPFWKGIMHIDCLPDCATWINMIEHHDEMYMGYYARDTRRWIGEYLKTHSGMVYKNGMSAGCRLADGLDGNEQRILTSIFCLYMVPGTPMIYSGTEIGASSNWEHGRKTAENAKKIFEQLGVYASEEKLFDGRELHRGALSRQMLEDGEKGGIGRFVKRLNEVRKKWRAISMGKMRSMDSGDMGVLCMGRMWEDERLVCVGNVTALEKKVSGPVGQMSGVVGDGWREDGWRDLLSGERVKVERDGGKWTVELGAYGRLLLCPTGL